MPTRPRARALLTLALLSLSLLACRGGDANRSGVASPTPAVPGAAATSPTPTQVARTVYPLAVPAGDGRSLTLPRAPERIVSLSPGHTEILFAIGAGGRVVATDRFSDFPEAATALPKVDYSNPNLEALAALRPDLVVAASRQRALAPTFEQAGLKVLLVEEPGSVAGVIERVRLLGLLTDRQPAAEELASRLQGRVDAVTGAVKDVAAGPRVYHELDPKLYSAAPASFVGDLYTLLKARNIAPAGANPYPQLAAEAIVAADPEVIVLAAGDRPGGTPEEVRRRPGWDTIAAVKANRVYAVPGDLVSRPGPRIVEGLEQLARLLYPGRFP